MAVRQLPLVTFPTATTTCFICEATFLPPLLSPICKGRNSVVGTTAAKSAFLKLEEGSYADDKKSDDHYQQKSVLEQTVFVVRILFGVPSHVFLDKSVAPIVNENDGSVQHLELCHDCKKAVDQAKDIYKGLLDAMYCFKRIRMELAQKMKSSRIRKNLAENTTTISSRRGNLSTRNNESEENIKVQGEWRKFVTNCNYTSDHTDSFTIEDFTATVENLAKSLVPKLQVEQLESQKNKALNTQSCELVEDAESLNDPLSEQEPIGFPTADFQVKSDWEYSSDSDEVIDELEDPLREQEEEEPEWKPDEDNLLASSSDEEKPVSNDDESSDEEYTPTTTTKRDRASCKASSSLQDDTSIDSVNQKLFPCSFEGCSRTFGLIGALKRHITTKHNLVEFKCEKCDLKFDTRKDLTGHLLKLHPLKCSMCPRHFHDEISLKLHLVSGHHLVLPRKPIRKSFPCTEEGCNTVYKTWEALQVHTAKHKGVPGYKCTNCDAAFYSRSQLARHDDKIHKSAGTGRFFVCEICGRSYQCLAYLQSHSRDIHGGKDHSSKKKGTEGSSNQDSLLEICDQCGKQCANKRSLYNHIRNVHMGKRKDTVFCEVCNKGFVSNALRKNHLYREHKIGTEADCLRTSNGNGRNPNGRRRQKPYVPPGAPKYRCNLVGCRRAFYGKDAESHFKKHNTLNHGPDGNKMPFQCEICGKGLGTRTKLSQHVQAHTNKETKPFKCETCGRGFANTRNLRLHQLTVHNAPRMFKRKKETKPRSFLKNDTTDNDKQ